MANQRVHTVTKCLFCNKRQPATGEKSECFVEVNGVKQSKKAFWICDQCGVSEKDRTRALAGIVLAETRSKSCDGRSKESGVVQLVTVDENGSFSVEASKQHPVVESESGAGSCCCQACKERKHLEQEQLREEQNLQKYWLQLRHAVRQMYRDRLLRDGVTAKGKKFDLNHLRELIEKFCARDPHQLYQRLESLGREHVMELKVLLLQILVSPEKAGVTAISNSESIASNVSSEVAEHFLRSLLNFARQLFETVDNMKEFLSPLEKEHLEKFGVKWRVVNGNLFYSVVYQDPLLQATLPSIYSRLGVKMSEGDSEGNFSIILDPKSTPSHVVDMMTSLGELGRTMGICRDSMEDAQERMEKYLSKQMKIYKATLKAKQRILKQDLEFFKRQRRLLEEHVKKKELKKTNSGDEDVSAFSETPGCLIAGNGDRSNHEHSTSTAECIRCHRSRCPCDQCSISHLIACGLTSDNDIDLPDCVPFLDDLNDSSNSSCSDSEDSDYVAEEECVSDKSAKMDVICHKQTSIIGGDGQKVTKVEAMILPTGLYSSDYASTAIVQRHMDYAYGDWEVNVDPSTLLFSNRWEEILLSKCTKQKERKSKGGGEKPATVTDTENDTPKSKQNGQASDSKAKCENGISKVGDGSSSEKTVPSNQTTPAKVQACKRHSLSSCALSAAAKRSDGAVGSGDSSTRSTMAKSKCESKEKKTDVRTSPRKSSLTTTPTRTTQSTNCQQQQFTQEWFKDPKNAKYAKALLACAVAGNNKDAACLKELNLDVETVKKLYAQHVESAAAAVAIKGGDQSECQTNCGEAQKPKTATPMKAQRDGDSISADEDDDSWSDHSSVMSQKDKHCDCCYCEMFGHGGVDVQKPCGRDEYPQIRERLRLKLKKKGSELPSQRAENIDGYRGNLSVDDLVEYITGAKKNEQGGEGPVQSVGASKSSAKKSKKAQTKSKKSSALPQNESKKAEKRDQPPSPSPVAKNSESSVRLLEPDGEEQMHKRPNGNVEIEAAKPKDPPSSTQRFRERNGGAGNDSIMQSDAPQHSTAPKDKKSRQPNSEDEGVNIDEVFKPKDIDLNSTDLDEEELEVERFKRFVTNCQPRENREKVNLNIGHLLRDKKATAAAAVV